MSVQELAAKTAAEIRSRGWYTGSMACHRDFRPVSEDHVCKVCVVGGIATASTGDPWGFCAERTNGGRKWVTPDDEDVVGLLEALKAEAGEYYQYPDLIQAVTYWNDDRKDADMTGRLVLAALDKIAAS